MRGTDVEQNVQSHDTNAAFQLHGTARLDPIRFF